MKKLFFALSALAVIAACSKEQETETPEVDDENGEGTEVVTGPVTFTAILPETKTTLGDKNGNVWPNFWSAGDKISVNGVASNALEESAAGKASAEFTVDNVAAPYYAAYPASALSAYKAGSATITIPSTQKYVAGSYDPAAYVMLASGSGTELSFASAVAIVKVTPTGEKSITSIGLSSSDKIAGPFTTNFSTITPATGAANTVSVSSSTPVAAGTPWFIVVPAVDFSANGFDVFITDSEGGSMIHHLSPAKAWEAGKLYSEEIAYVPAVSDITISAEGITSSTAVICLPDETYAADALTFNVYSDAGCATLVDSYAVPEGNTCWGEEAPRFCISGLKPGNTYYVKVTDATSSKFSNILAVTTADFTIVEVSSNPASVGEVILAEDFGELRWDSELINKGVGFFPTSQDSFANSEVANDENSKFLPIDTNIEKVLSGQTKALEFSRLAHWAQGENANLYIHPGYIKIVGSKKVTHLVTPALDNIPDGMVATVEVEVTASAYYSESSASFATTSAIVAVQPAGDYNEFVDDSKTNALDLTTNIAPITLDAATAWKTYKVSLSGVGHGARLAFGAASDVTGNDARMNLSDMKVTITALEEPGIIASCKSVSSSTAVFTWTYGGEAADDIAKPYTFALYRNQACTDLVVSFNSAADADHWNGKTPAFVFGGLTPSTEFWFQVKDTENGAKSSPVSATTTAFTVVDATTISNAAVGDVILAEDFSEIGAGPDEIAKSAGFVPSTKVLPVVPSGENPEGSYVIDLVGYNPYGDRIIGAGWDLGSSRLSNGWGFFGGSSCYYGAGYLRLATSSGRTHIVTPALSGIPAGKFATIQVTVTASKYESSSNDVAVFAEKGLTLSSTDELSSNTYKKYTGASLSDGQALGITGVKSWETKSVTINKVESDHQLLIGSLEDAKNRCYISDIVVSIVSLKDKGAIDAVMEINDFASLKAFLTACEPEKAIQGNITADIDLTSAQVEEIDALYPVAEFEGIINGNNHTISGLTKPLFSEFSGTVSNLTLNSTLNITDEMDNIGILAGSAENATISGCVTNGSVTFNCDSGVSGNIFIAGMVGKISDGTMTNCVNNAPVTNSTDSGDTSDVISVGGLTGYANSVIFSKCVNNGAVTNTGIAGNKDTNCRVGGLVGWAIGVDLSASGEDKNINYGDVTESSDSKDTAFAGVVAYAEGTVSDFSNCRNEGTITLGGEKKYIFFGGIAGAFANSSKIDNTYNSGLITADGASMASTGYIRLGGIIGGWFKAACTAQTITGCTNTGAITITSDNLANYSSGAKPDCYVGGIAGGGNNDGVFGKELKNCTNSGNITLNGGSANSGKLYHMFCIGGIVGYTDVNPTGSKCIANIRFRSTKGTNRVGGIAGEMMIDEIHDVTYKGTVNTNGSGGTNFTGLLVGNVGTGERTFSHCTVSGTSHGANSTTLGSGIFFSCNGGGTGPTVNIASCTVGSGTCLQTAASGNYITITSADQITAENVCGTNGTDRTCTTGTNDDLSTVVDPDTITL